MAFRNLVGFSGVFEKVRRRLEEQMSFTAGDEMKEDAFEA